MNRLFNPFRHIAGTKALVLGIIFIVSSSALLYGVGMIQDSYVHVSMSEASFWHILLVQLLWWIVPALLLCAGGLFFSKSKFRIVDVLGTTAFAQLSMIPMIAPLSIPAVKNGSSQILEAVQQGVQPAMSDMATVMAFGLWSTLFLVLFYVWNYNAFATSCNVRGAKAILYFIAVQVLLVVAGGIL